MAEKLASLKKVGGSGKQPDAFVMYYYSGGAYNTAICLAEFGVEILSDPSVVTTKTFTTTDGKYSLKITIVSSWTNTTLTFRSTSNGKLIEATDGTEISVTANTDITLPRIASNLARQGYLFYKS